ncbi:MAG: TOBE domain-containing protein, partial [Pseudomonadota bacterium]
LYNAPANVFVADFIGEPPTNFFRCDVADDGRALKVRGADLACVTTEARAAALRARGASGAIAGVRPQNLKLGEGAATVAATVAINEYLGERSILTVTNGGATFRALAPPETGAARGEAVALAYDPKDVMVFDETSEALIE